MGDDTIEVVPNLEISVGSSTDALGEYPITLQAGSPANYELTLRLNAHGASHGIG